MNERDKFVRRVDQVDADILDDELFSRWKQELMNIFKYFKPTFLNNIEPELNAVLRLIIWKISVKTFDATIGQQLLLMKYHEASKHQCKLYLYAFGIVGCHWLKDRADAINILIGKSQWNVQWLRKVFDWGEIMIKLTSFINFLIFIHEGKYLMLIERILGLKKVPSVVGFRQLGYDYMARELLHQGFSEFTSFLLPFINWKNLWRHICPTKKLAQLHSVNLEFCSICTKPYCRPHKIGCEHVFCYYCIQQQFVVDAVHSCPVCGHEGSNVTPL